MNDPPSESRPADKAWAADIPTKDESRVSGHCPHCGARPPSQIERLDQIADAVDGIFIVEMVSANGIKRRLSYFTADAARKAGYRAKARGAVAIIELRRLGVVEWSSS